MHQDDETISKLLRLKRHEQPGPEYFENFLREFQYRQRAELLRRPAWRIALDRAEAYFAQLTLSQLSYATASAAVLMLAGVVTFNIVQHPGARSPQEMLASRSSGNSDLAMAQPVRMASAELRSQPASAVVVSQQFTLDPQISFPESSQARTVQTGMGSQRPRYIIDARPVSYEPPFSF